MSSNVYRNKLVINQRGGSIDINNTTEQEYINLSQRSGSNIRIDNVTNSELATNNKQVAIVNDSFETVGNDKSSFVAKDNVERVGGNTYQLKGFINESELMASKEWQEAYRDIANYNSQFKLKRGGVSYPNGDSTELQGTRVNNPVVGSSIYSVENEFNGYSGVPVRKASVDEVVTYAKVPDRGRTVAAREKKVTVEDVEKSAGASGSKAPGVLEFGAEKSAATEGGSWEPNDDALEINLKILELQDTLSEIEQRMGHGGDEIIFNKRNSIETVGSTFNDYPSVRIDEKGRSQPFEILVSDSGAYKNHDYLPHVEEIDNSSNFPGGEKTIIANNKFGVVAGSGGISFKTTGAMEIGASTVKVGAKKININASHGLQIASEAGVEIQSLKSIVLRTNRQVYVEGGLGVRGNSVFRGGTYTEGETYLQHVTAPLEVQQTEDTIAFGKFAATQNRTLVIGEAQVGGAWYPVYAVANDDLLYAYPHSHHFNNLPLRLTKANEDVRKFAQSENINNHSNINQSLPQIHEKKTAKEA
jgi:hypothetical protein